MFAIALVFAVVLVIVVALMFVVALAFDELVPLGGTDAVVLDALTPPGATVAFKIIVGSKIFTKFFVSRPFKGTILIYVNDHMLSLSVGVQTL